MGYVDAGYSICLTALFFYALSLYLRHRRSLRSATVTAAPVPPAAGSVQMVGADPAGGAAPSDGESRRADQSGTYESGIYESGADRSGAGR